MPRMRYLTILLSKNIQNRSVSSCNLSGTSSVSVRWLGRVSREMLFTALQTSVFEMSPKANPHESGWSFDWTILINLLYYPPIWTLRCYSKLINIYIIIYIYIVNQFSLSLLICWLMYFYEDNSYGSFFHILSLKIFNMLERECR